MRVSGRRPTFEAIPRLAGESFAVRRFSVPSFPLQWHRHPEVEITLIEQGQGVRFIGDHVDPFGPGDLVVLGSDLPHTWSSDPKDGRGRSVVIQFLPAILGSVLETVEMRKVRTMLDRSSRGLVFGDSSELRGLMIRTFRARAGTPARMACLIELLASLGEAAADARPISIAPGTPHGARASAVMDRAVNRLLTRLGDGENPTQAEIARDAGMEPWTFSRQFKAAVGKTFVKYTNDWRVARVCQGLIQSDQSVTELAFEAGFDNLSNFNRRFRQITGETPRGYRKLWRV